MSWQVSSNITTNEACAQADALEKVIRDEFQDFLNPKSPRYDKELLDSYAQVQAARRLMGCGEYLQDCIDDLQCKVDEIRAKHGQGRTKKGTH